MAATVVRIPADATMADLVTAVAGALRGKERDAWLARDWAGGRFQEAREAAKREFGVSVIPGGRRKP